MGDSLRPPLDQDIMKTHQQQPKKRLCDYCNDTTALLYCRADSAKLCISCDREVHSTNQLFYKHTRSLLCDACDSSPASIFCETDHSVLCQNCDWERHNFSLSSVHNRRPIEGFNGCRSLSELVNFLGFEDLSDKKALFLNEESNGLVGSGHDGSDFGDGYSDLFVWESPAVVSLNDLISLSDSGQNFQAMEVPPLPKNRNAVCGQHKDEILRQLRELARSEYPEAEPIDMFQKLAARENKQPQNMHAVCEPDARPAPSPPYEESIFNWLNDTGEGGNQVCHPSAVLRSDLEGGLVVPEKQQPDIGSSLSHANGSHKAETPLPLSTRMISVLPKVGSHDLNSQERNSALSRYKEKKKTRRFEKHIRYESRKVRAESRTRIKGRFAKIER